jgi:hypothetical protein
MKVKVAIDPITKKDIGEYVQGLIENGDACSSSRKLASGYSGQRI